MKLGSQLPSLDAATAWLNRTTENNLETKGRLTLVHFWSVTSQTSQANLSLVAELRDQRRHEGLRVVAIHLMPPNQKMDRQAVQEAVTRLNLTEPCALDKEHKLRDAFSNYLGIMPAYYLFNVEGKLSRFAAGETGFEVIESELDRILAELRGTRPFCPGCEMFLSKEAMFCSECGLPLKLPGSGGPHPYYEKLRAATLPTIRLADPDPLVGQIIDGKYELTSRLGEGSMSVVYRARRVHIGDEVAVKILRRKFVNDEAAVARFRREARAAAMLHHPNVITIHDFGETDDNDVPAYIVMEFINGITMRDLLKSEKYFGVERAVRLMRGICAAVGAAHRVRLVHRDLKPENILVVAPDGDSEFESVRVADFGLAKLLAESNLASTGAVIGTPYYMSPEQCLGEPLNTRSDVYSLGAMLHEMLSGEPPFTAETVSGIISKQLTEPAPPLPASLSISRRIQTAIKHALEKDPEARPQTATDFARQL